MSQQNIPVLDLQPQIQTHWKEFTEAAERVLKSGHFILGPEVAAFEKEVAQYLGVKHAIGVNSGTDAILLGLRAAGVGPGDEVICPSFTFFATSEVVNLCGAEPVFIDIRESSMNMDYTQLDSLYSPKTKAIIPVHLFGQACDMDPIMEWAKDKNVKVIEDTCQGMGSEYKSKKLGAIGDMGAFSFFPTKNLGAFGDGGLFTTNNDQFAELARKLRTHGSIKKYHNEMIGYNSRLDEMQAAFLRIKLKHIDKWNQGRHRVAQMYKEAFMGNNNIAVPHEEAFGKHIFHQFTIQIKNGKRDQVHEALTKAGISSMIYYPIPCHQLPVYKGLSHPRLPVTEQLAKEVLSLPIWPEMEPQAIQRVAQEIKKAL